MKSINHAQARSWIQAAADGRLEAPQQETLQAHLDGCAECRTYAAEVRTLENTIRHALLARWGMPQLPPRAVDRLVHGVKTHIGKGGSFMTGKGSLIKWLLGLGAMGAGGLCLILGFGSYRVYSQVGARQAAVSPVNVWFDNPRQGSQLPGGGPIPIAAGAQGQYPILYMQLEVGGEVVGIVGAPSADGVTPFSASFNWDPDEIKPYTLTARAFDSMGYESQATLFLEVVAPEQVTEEDIQGAYASSGPHAPSGLGQGGGGGSPPPPDQQGPPYQPPPPPTPPAIDLSAPDYELSKSWSPGLLDWFDFVFNDPDPPAAPGIPATAVEGCKPRIWISDNSDNEDGFRVMRRDPGMIAFHEVAVEAAYDGPVFTFEDQPQGLYGTYEYQVSAFNQNGESFSNISSPLAIDSPNCQPDNQPVIQIDLAKIFTQQSYDMGYCYYSFDALNWLRHPANPEEFFGSGETDQIPESLLEIFDEGSGRMFDLECWGWFGGGLQMVGKWHFDDVLQDNLEIGLAKAGEIDWIPYGGGTGGGGPYDPDLPIPHAGLGHGSEDCALWYNQPFSFLKGLICGDIADDADFVYAVYLCIFGPCTPQEDIVGYNFYDTLSGSGVPIKFVEAPENIYFPIDPTACTARLIHVTMLVEVNGEVHESLPSNPVIYTPEEICGYLAGTEPHMYRITWETIDFSVGNIDDGADADDDAEAFGWLGLETGTGHKIYWHMPLHDDGFEDDSEDNPYDFSDFLLSHHDTPCLGIFCWLGGGAGASTGNNAVDFPLFLGEGFRLTVNLTEYDDDYEHDLLCYIDPYSDNFSWNANAIGGPGWVTTASRTKHHNDASCKVTVMIEALP